MPQDSPISRRDLLGVGAGAAAGLLAFAGSRLGVFDITLRPAG